MFSGMSETSKRWFTRKKRTLPLKRFRSQPNLQTSKENTEEPPPERIAPKKPVVKVLVEFADSNQDEDTPQASPISIVQLNVVMGPDSQLELPIGPPSPEVPPTTEEEFEHAITEAQRYKDACAAAEDAAEDESRRRFKHYQDMYYLEKALQEKSAEAQKKLHKLFQGARQAGFIQLLPPARITAEGTESRSSHDTIGRFMDRLDAMKLSEVM